MVGGGRLVHEILGKPAPVERRSIQTVTVEHHPESVMLYDQQLLCK